MMRFFVYIGIALISCAGLLVSTVAYVLVSTPRPKNIRDCLVTQMYKVSLCPKDSSYARLRSISSHVKYAVIVSEDGSFYDHKGIDWVELKKSAEANWQKGKFVRGGSTITQQLAKNVYLNPEKSLLRKAREALIAIQLEETLSKEEILEKYLNVVEFGPDIYGVTAATRYYFGKSPGSVTPVEAAFLAFLLPNPKMYSASFRKKELTPFARKGIREIVNRLYRYGKISQEQHVLALEELGRLFKPAAPMEDESSMEAAFDSAFGPEGDTGSAPADAEAAPEATLDSLEQQLDREPQGGLPYAEPE